MSHGGSALDPEVVAHLLAPPRDGDVIAALTPRERDAHAPDQPRPPTLRAVTRRTQPTKRRVRITEEVIEELAAEAERGYDPTKLRRTSSAGTFASSLARAYACFLTITATVATTTIAPAALVQDRASPRMSQPKKTATIGFTNAYVETCVTGACRRSHE